MKDITPVDIRLLRIHLNTVKDREEEIVQGLLKMLPDEGAPVSDMKSLIQGLVRNRFYTLTNTAYTGGDKEKRQKVEERINSSLKLFFKPWEERGYDIQVQETCCLGLTATRDPSGDSPNSDIFETRVEFFMKQNLSASY